MVMGPTHAASGAALALWGAPVVAASLGHHLPTQEVYLVGGVVSGFALWPDIDMPTTSVSRAFGPVSWIASKTVNEVSSAVYQATRTPRDDRRDGGHRALTHTAVFAALTGFAVTALVVTFGRAGTAGVLFFALALALRGLMHEWAIKNGWIAVLTVAAAGTWMVMQGVHGSSGFWWLGLAAAVGTFAHDLGDCPTKQGAPLWWPLKIRGKRWYDVAPPGFLRFSAGGVVDGVLCSALGAATILGAIWTYDPDLVRRILTV